MKTTKKEEPKKRYVHPVISVPVAEHCNPGMWVGFLDGPYQEDPRVLIYMVPRSASFSSYEANEPKYKGCSMTTCEFKHVNDDTGQEEDYRMPLQLTGMDFGNWVQQKKIIEQEMQGRFHPVAFDGLLSEIPRNLTMSLDFKPIAILYSKPHENMLDLVAYMTNLTKAAAING